AAELFDLVYGFQQRKNIDEKKFSVTANLIVRKYVFDTVGVFNENLKSKGDCEWCNRAVSNGFSIYYESRCVVVHPARRSLKDLISKTRRIAGGQNDIKTVEIG